MSEKTPVSRFYLAVVLLLTLVLPAVSIFHIDHELSHEIVRELGFANLWVGLVGVLSLFLPSWRVVSAFAGGLYNGLAGLNHCIKKPGTANEAVALVSDLFIFLVVAVGFVPLI
jgi:hypothetical protein